MLMVTITHLVAVDDGNTSENPLVFVSLVCLPIISSGRIDIPREFVGHFRDCTANTASVTIFGGGKFVWEERQRQRIWDKSRRPSISRAQDTITRGLSSKLF